MDENPFVGDGRDGTVVDQIIDQTPGDSPIEISRHDASPISVLCDELFFESFVIVRRIVVHVVFSYQIPARRLSAPHACRAQ